MLLIISFALGFLGGLTYGRVKLISWLLFIIVILLGLGWLDFSI